MMMSNPPDMEYSWDSLETTTLILPMELLTFYLYKYQLDSKSKKEVQSKEDLYFINYYLNILQIKKEVALNVFQINK